jgi:hypothetical protein
MGVDGPAAYSSLVEQSSHSLQEALSVTHIIVGHFVDKFWHTLPKASVSAQVRNYFDFMTHVVRVRVALGEKTLGASCGNMVERVDKGLSADSVQRLARFGGLRREGIAERVRLQ